MSAQVQCCYRQNLLGKARSFCGRDCSPLVVPSLCVPAEPCSGNFFFLLLPGKKKNLE